MTLTQKSKDFLNFLLRIAVSAALLLWLFSKIDIEKTVNILKSADLFYICIAAVAFLFINSVLLLRWLVFIKALELTASLKDVVRFFFFGLFGNLFLPSSIGGDIIKIIGLCKYNAQKPKVVASVILDRLSGFAAIALVAVSAFILGYQLVQESSILPMILILAAGSFVAGGLLFNERIYSFGCRIFDKLPKVKAPLMQLHYDIALLKNKKVEGLKGIALSCLSQMIYSWSFFILAKALHQDVNLVYFLIFVPMLCVATSLPSIGGLGVREAGAAYLFAKVGMDSGVAVSISLISYMFMVFVGLLGGLVYVVTLPSRRVQYHPSDSKAG